MRFFEIACVDDEHLQAVFDVREACIRIVVEREHLDVRVSRLHSLGESSAGNVVCQAGERLHNDKAVDAVRSVVKDFARNQPTFTGVVRRIDDVADELDEFVAVCVMLVELVTLVMLLDRLRRMRVDLCRDAADEPVFDRLCYEAALELFTACLLYTSPSPRD